MEIRKEQNADFAAIRNVNRQAFGREEEGNLVDDLRRNEGLICSLVAEVAGEVVGHVAFSPAILEDADGSTMPLAGLGPVAVLPAHQNKGAGEGLIRTGLAICREQGYAAAVVLGHPGYYPRFGFRPSRPLGIRWEHDAPEEAFMVMELTPGALAGLNGTIRYRPEFEGV